MQLEITPKRWTRLFQGERRVAVKIRGVVPGEKGGMLGGRSSVEWNGRKYVSILSHFKLSRWSTAAVICPFQRLHQQTLKPMFDQ
jgi:hypothetical protein